MFGAKLKSFDWVKNNLNKKQRRRDQVSFAYTTIEFHYHDDLDKFEILLKIFRRDSIDDIDEQKTNGNCNIFGEHKKFDRLIVMGKVSGLADKSNNFINFLTICRKFGYICLYIFHIIYPTKSIWQKILSQMKIFNIFLSAIQLANILKILTNNCDRETANYIPARDLWINRFYFSLSNESKYS